MLCADAAAPGELGLRGNGRIAAVVPNPGDVLLLSESGFPRCPLIFSPSLSASRRRRESRTPRGDRHRRCVQPTHSRAAFACTAHSRPPRDAPAWPRARRTPRLQSLGCHRAAESKPACVRVGCEGRRCHGRELSALACLAGRHAAAWSADGSGLEHRLLWHQATERRQQSPEAADPEGRAAHGWADRDHGEARWRQERRSFRCRRRGEQIRRRHWRGLTCAEATALPPSLHRICAPSARSGTRGG